MAKLFSFASWNAHNLKSESARAKLMVEFLAAEKPDVFGMLEVLGRDVYRDLMKLLPDHSFFITEDQSQQEILVGVNRKFPAFLTQRLEFKSQMPTLRPGALVSITAGGAPYTILFLHTKAMSDPRAWGLRDDMFGHVFELKKALDKIPGAPATGARFICLGDFNTVGMNVTYSDKDFSSTEELKRIEAKLKSRKLRLCTKTHDTTLWGGTGSSYDPADVDNVFASESIQFKQFNGADIQTLGWPTMATDAQKTAWIKKYSDHAMLYGEVQV